LTQLEINTSFVLNNSTLIYNQNIHVASFIFVASSFITRSFSCLGIRLKTRRQLLQESTVYDASGIFH